MLAYFFVGHSMADLVEVAVLTESAHKPLLNVFRTSDD